MEIWQCLLNWFCIAYSLFHNAMPPSSLSSKSSKTVNAVKSFKKIKVTKFENIVMPRVSLAITLTGMGNYDTGIVRSEVPRFRPRRRLYWSIFTARYMYNRAAASNFSPFSPPSLLSLSLSVSLALSLSPSFFLSFFLSFSLSPLSLSLSLSLFALPP